MFHYENGVQNLTVLVIMYLAFMELPDIIDMICVTSRQLYNGYKSKIV